MRKGGLAPISAISINLNVPVRRDAAAARGGRVMEANVQRRQVQVRVGFDVGMDQKKRQAAAVRQDAHELHLAAVAPDVRAREPRQLAIVLRRAV